MPPAELWMDERLVVRDSSIEGRGLFFTDRLPEGATVIRLGGRLVSSEELDALIRRAEVDPAAPYVDTITVYDDVHLVLRPNTPIHFGNHSCDPSLWLVGPFEVATRRDVTVGEEATIDYGTVSGAEGFRMVCRCRASACRGEVTDADWRRVGAPAALSRSLGTCAAGADRRRVTTASTASSESRHQRGKRCLTRH